MVIKYASVDAEVLVYSLSKLNSNNGQVSFVFKRAGTYFQAPGCDRDCLNGIDLPTFIDHTIVDANLDQRSLYGWEECKQDVQKALRGLKGLNMVA